ncbi:hypothetical protein [Fructilactobacillus sanfranciscensis]|uniref:hypothetical protein n=1 Tax=Fructilactobacillus sanfranciscensis TaxID=1625 RepID=UPI001CDAD50A|nr:hypothetical protein [Fructilactobacillus sanfranciscensis]
MAPSLGVAPYDAIAPIISTRFHIKYKTARVGQDVCFLVAALIAGGPIGFASIVVAFFAGPLISYWDRSISTPTMDYINDLSEQPSFNHWQMWLPALLNLDITHCQMLIIQL